MVTGEKTPQSVKNLQKELEKIDKEYTQIRARTKDLEQQKTSIETRMTFPQNAQEMQYNQSQLRYLEMEIAQANEKAGSLYANGERIQDSLEQMRLNPFLIPEIQRLHQQIGYEATNVEILNDKVKALGEKYNSAGKEAKKAFDRTSSGAKRTARHTARAENEMMQLWNRLKSLAASALVFNTISSGLGSLKDKIIELLMLNTDFSDSISAIYGNLLTAFQPIYDVIIPILNSFMDKLKIASSYIASFVAVLFGNTVKGSQAAAESLQNQADAAENLRSALGTYDELEVIGQSETGQEETEGPIFGVTDFDSSFESIKDAIENGDVSGVITAMISKLNGALAGIDGKAFIEGAKKVAGIISSSLNSVTGTFDFDALGELLADGLNGITEFLFDLITKTNWKGLGDSIGTFLYGALKRIDFRKIGNTITELINSATRMITSFFSSIDFSVIGMDIANLILGLLESIDANALADVITTVLTSVIMLVSGLLEVLDFSEILTIVNDIIITLIQEINWVELGSALVVLLYEVISSSIDALCALSFEAPLQLLAGLLSGMGLDGAAEFLLGLKDGLSDAVEHVQQCIKDYITDPIKDFLGLDSGSSDLFNIGVEAVAELIVGFEEEMVKAWDKVTKWCDEYIVQPVESSFNDLKNVWNIVKNTFADAKPYFISIWNGIKAAFANPADWFRNKFSQAWAAVKNVFSKGGTIFIEIKDGVLQSLKHIINGLIDGINQVITTPFEGLNDALSSIRNISVGTLKPFKDIGTISVPQIPHLASGAVIPANREFLAVLGDQKHGTNIETPLETMIKAFNTALDSRDEGGDIVVELDGREVGRASRRNNKERVRRYGYA